MEDGRAVLVGVVRLLFMLLGGVGVDVEKNFLQHLSLKGSFATKPFAQISYFLVHNAR